MEGKNKKLILLFLLLFIIIILFFVMYFMKLGPFKSDITKEKPALVSPVQSEEKEPVQEQPVEEQEEPQIIEPDSISLDQVDITLFVDESKTIIATVTPVDAVDKIVSWSSSDDTIVSVSNGRITGLKEGTATITASTSNGKTAFANVKVISVDTKIISVNKVSLKASNTVINVGEKITIGVNILPDNATDKTIIWSSSDNQIAVVSGGEVTGINPGTVTIVAKSSNGKKASIKVTVKEIEPTSISLDKEEVDLKIGESILLETTILPSNATNKKVSWSSSDEKIVTVKDGKITGVNPGTAIITASTSNGKKVSIRVIVKAIEPTSVTLNKKDITIKIEESVTLEATINPSNTTNKKLSWSSSDEKIVTVKDGKITGIKNGTAVITVTTSNGKTDKCNVIVEVVPVTGITLNDTVGTINVGETFQLIATVNPSNATNKNVTWLSSDSSVATVSDNGLVKGIKDGTANITVTSDNGKTATYAVTVKTPVTGVSLDRTAVYMLPENSKEPEETYKRTLKATVSPSDATNKEVIWSSSDTSVATVDSNGVVLAKKAGNATITVKTKDGSKTAKATVRVDSNELTNIYDVAPTAICELVRNASDNVRAMQGVYFYKSGSTAYALYAGYQADDKPTVMTLVNLNTCTVVAKNNEQVFGHANDIGYYNGKFYVVNSNKVHGLTITDNKTITLDANPIKMNYSFSGFEYDPVSKKFYAKGGNYIHTFPKFTSSKASRIWVGIVPSYYSNIDGGNIKIVNQGLAFANGNIYIPRTISDTNSTHYNHSYIQVYDANTIKYKYTIHYSNYLCHLEGMTVIGDSMYLGMNCHQASPKNQTFLVYNGLADLEQRYQNS